LAPMHESASCVEAPTPLAKDDEGRQKPFQNLRDMLRER
jgi:hypothetical protein